MSGWCILELALFLRYGKSKELQLSLNKLLVLLDEDCSQHIFASFQPPEFFDSSVNGFQLNIYLLHSVGGFNGSCACVSRGENFRPNWK